MARRLYSVHLSTAKTWRGGENQVWLLAKGLQQRNQKVLVLAPASAPLLQRCASAGVPAQALGFCCELDPFGILKLALLLRREKPDILDLHDGHALLPGQLAARCAGLRGLRVVAHRRTAFAVKGRWKYGRGVDRIIAISAAVREKLLAAGIPAGKIAIAHSGLEFRPVEPGSAGVPPAPVLRHSALEFGPQSQAGQPAPHDENTVAQEAAALRIRLHVAGGAVLVAHAAALTAEKRQLDCITALARANAILKERGGPALCLALAGAGEEEARLRQEISRRGLEAEVHLLGFMADLRPLWAASGMALFASEAEGLCTALIEAQGAALPAVITRAGGMVEVVAAGENGLVVEVGDIEGLAAALVKLAEDPGLRQRLGGAGAKLVRQKFSCEAMVEGVLRVYDEPASGH
ncbi:MAG: glycosyltransferase family 4 protein [Planctomycetota bacterium]